MVDRAKRMDDGRASRATDFCIVEQSPARSVDADINGPWSRQARHIYVVPKDSGDAKWVWHDVSSPGTGEGCRCDSAT